MPFSESKVEVSARLFISCARRRSSTCTYQVSLCILKPTASCPPKSTRNREEVPCSLLSRRVGHCQYLLILASLRTLPLHAHIQMLARLRGPIGPPRHTTTERMRKDMRHGNNKMQSSDFIKSFDRIEGQIIPAEIIRESGRGAPSPLIPPPFVFTHDVIDSIPPNGSVHGRQAVLGHVPLWTSASLFGMPHGTGPDLLCSARCFSSSAGCSPRRADYLGTARVRLCCCTAAPTRYCAQVHDLSVSRRTPRGRCGVRGCGVTERASLPVEEDEAGSSAWRKRS